MVEDGAQLIVQGLEIRLGIVLTRGRVGMTKHGVLPLHDIGRGDVTELSLPEVRQNLCLNDILFHETGALL